MSHCHAELALSLKRSQLASFEHAYRVAIQRCRASGRHQFVVRTGDPQQPFRTTSRAPGQSESVLAMVA